MKKRAIVLQLPNVVPYDRNLKKILKYIKEAPSSSIIVAPEVSLTDYDYANLKEAALFSKKAIEIFKEEVDDKIFTITMLVEDEDGFYNEAVVFNRGKIIHRQRKHKLFLLGDEDKYLKRGNIEEIKVFEVDGIKMGLLICFELRFIELWQRLKDAQIILLPSQWGAPRKDHLDILSKALAITNQAFVLLANSAKETMARSSSIIYPTGGIIKDDYKEKIEGDIDLNDIKFIKRYLRL